MNEISNSSQYTFLNTLLIWNFLHRIFFYKTTVISSIPLLHIAQGYRKYEQTQPGRSSVTGVKNAPQQYSLLTTNNKKSKY